MKNSLSENIRALRIRSGISQVELAKAMSVSKQCVSNWENDNVQPSIEMLEKLADYFRISTDQLLGRSAEQTVEVSDLTEEQRAHIRLMVRDFAKANKNWE